MKGSGHDKTIPRQLATSRSKVSINPSRPCMAVSFKTEILNPAKDQKPINLVEADKLTTDLQDCVTSPHSVQRAHHTTSHREQAPQLVKATT